MPIKLIAIDIDGTLLSDDLTISPKNIEILREVKERNVLVTLCTGRPHVAAKHFANILDIEGPLISHNGAYIVDTRSKKILLNDTLDKETAIDILEFAGKDSRFTFSVHYGDECYIEKEDEFNIFVQTKVNMVDPQLVPSLIEYIKCRRENPTKLLATGSDRDLDELTPTLKRKFNLRAGFLRSGTNYLDIMALSVSKGRGLEILSRLLDIDRREIVAIGDNFNDLDMLCFAGIGIAMANAPEEVRLKADMVVPSNNEDGVAFAIQKLMDERLI